MKGKTKIFNIIFVIYMIALIMITVIRPWDPHYQLFGGEINLSLFTEYKTVIQAGIFQFIYLFAGNIIWFIPFGLYLTACKRRSMLMTVFMGLGLSLIIEIMQFVLGTGVSEIDDLILNTFGCFIGCLIYNIIRAVKNI